MGLFKKTETVEVLPPRNERYVIKAGEKYLVIKTEYLESYIMPRRTFTWVDELEQADLFSKASATPIILQFPKGSAQTVEIIRQEV